MQTLPAVDEGVVPQLKCTQPDRSPAENSQLHPRAPSRKAGDVQDRAIDQSARNGRGEALPNLTPASGSVRRILGGGQRGRHDGDSARPLQQRPPTSGSLGLRAETYACA